MAFVVGGYVRVKTSGEVGSIAAENGHACKVCGRWRHQDDVTHVPEGHCKAAGAQAIVEIKHGLTGDLMCTLNSQSVQNMSDLTCQIQATAGIRSGEQRLISGTTLLTDANLMQVLSNSASGVVTISVIRQADIGALLACSTCKSMQPRSHFSSNQRMKGDANRKCNVCTGNANCPKVVCTECEKNLPLAFFAKFARAPGREVCNECRRFEEDFSGDEHTGEYMGHGEWDTPSGMAPH